MNLFLGNVVGDDQEGNELLVKLDKWQPQFSDAFSISGVNHINPTTKEDTGHLRYFIVTRSMQVAHGWTRLHIQPPIIPRGHYMNVSAIPEDGAVLTASPFNAMVGLGNEEELKRLNVFCQEPEGKVC